MATLADSISVRTRFARSANLERDSGRSEPFDGYIVTGRALDVVGRVTAAAVSGRSGGAWSLTGPYGSGKSSLALLLDAAFGPSKRVRSTALALIADAAPAAAEAIRKAHDRHGTRRTGFQRGLVTANREPITHTLLRALHARGPRYLRSDARPRGSSLPRKPSRTRSATLKRGAHGPSSRRRSSKSPAASRSERRCC